MTRLFIDDRPPTDILMDALSVVEKAKRVVILLEHDEALTVKTNCTHQEMYWILSQAKHVAMADLFDTGDV